MRIDGDRVAFVHKCNGAASCCFGRHVSHHHAPGAARETAIGNQADAFAQTSANECTRGGQHFGHARATFGAEVTQDHDVASFDLAIQNGLQSRLLVVEHAGRACDHGVLQTCDFGHGTFR